jgi:hypothetical protein
LQVAVPSKRLGGALELILDDLDSLANQTGKKR